MTREKAKYWMTQIGFIISVVLSVVVLGVVLSVVVLVICSYFGLF